MHKIIQAFFWLAFASFLAASIPHVAFFFASYESMESPILSWTIAYSLAISIDVTIYLLCTVIARGTRGASFIWVFIVALTLLSCYLNYQYATQFHTSMLDHAVPLVLPYVGNINAYIASSFPILIVAFTWMSDKLNITASETLEQKAVRLEGEREAKTRIREATKGYASSRLIGLLDAVNDVKKHVTSLVEPATSETPAPTHVEPVTRVTVDTPLVETATLAPTLASDSLPISIAVAPSISDHLPVETPGGVDTEKVPAIANGHTSETPALQELPRYIPKRKRNG